MSSLIDVCQDFMKEVARSVILDHSVDNEEFVVKIFFEKDQLEHLID